jgi:hypothetical protein
VSQHHCYKKIPPPDIGTGPRGGELVSKFDLGNLARH